jgi:hypothetical protein
LSSPHAKYGDIVPGLFGATTPYLGPLKAD